MSTQEVIGVLLSLTAVCSYVNYKFMKLPKSIGITLVALLITVVVTIAGVFDLGIREFAESLLDNIGFNETFLHGMLSFLLFAGSLHINALELSKHKLLVFSFSTISVIISTLIIGYSMYYLTAWLNLDLPFYYCFVFGALISPTDAIAVMGLLKVAKIPKSLQLKISGEALFNDGMGIVLFFMALALATGEKRQLEASDALLYFAREGLGGMVVGAGMGWVVGKILDSIEDYELAIIFTLALVTGGYVLATSVLDVSGPICMAVAGLIIGSSFKCQRNLVLFWDLLDEILNAILFVLIGLEFMSIKFDMNTLLASFGAVLVCILARWLSIFIPVAFNSKFKKINRDIINVMTWAGLRGGISIALALSLTNHHRDLILSITYVVVLFSIVIQGLTMRRVIASADLNS